MPAKFKNGIDADSQRIQNVATPTASSDAIPASTTLSTTAISSSNKIVDASGTNTVSGTALSSTNKIVDGTAFTYGLNGVLAPNGYTASGSRTFAAQTLYYMRFYCPTPMTVTKLGVAITTTTASGSDWIDMGIFSSATGGARLASTGIQTGVNTANQNFVQSLSSPYTMAAGTTYYIGIFCNVATVTIAGTASTVSTNTIFGTSYGQALFGSVPTTSALSLSDAASNYASPGRVFGATVTSTSGSTSATLGGTTSRLVSGTTYYISSTGIPSANNIYFTYSGSTSITLSSSTGVTNATGATATIQVKEVGINSSLSAWPIVAVRTD